LPPEKRPGRAAGFGRRTIVLYLNKIKTPQAGRKKEKPITPWGPAKDAGNGLRIRADEVSNHIPKEISKKKGGKGKLGDGGTQIKTAV